MLGPSASRYAPNISAPAGKAFDATSRAEWLLFLLICSIFAFRARLIFTLNVNWDEFFYLSKIYSHQRGDLASQLQTFQVHLFGWLTGLGGNEIDQIVVARAVMLALSAIACLLIYRIARLHFSSTVSLLCVLCYLTFSEVLRHGASFRADPLYAPLVLVAVYAAMRPSRSPLAPAIGGASLAVALMVTIKTALFLPIIGLLLLVRVARAGFTVDSLRPAFALGSVLLVAFAAMFAFHDLLLPTLSAETDVALVRQSYDRTIMHGDLFPRWRWAVLSLMDSVLPWSTTMCGIAMALRRVILRKGRVPLRDVDIVCLSLPLAMLLLYRNAFPYFYVLVLGLAVIASGVTLDWLAGRFGDMKNRAAVYSLCGVLLAGFFLLGGGRYMDDQTRGERALLSAVHHMFPEPVPYIDRCSMVGSFPKVGFFMSSWGLEVYRAAGRPVMRSLLETRQPPLLIANSRALDISGPHEDSGSSEAYRLLREDFEILKENFIPHWGHLYVAGKSVSFDRDSPSRTIEILIAGTYTIEGSAVMIDGEAAPVGSKVKLKKGRHTMRAIATPATVVLRWGTDLYRPEGEPPSSIFTGL